MNMCIFDTSHIGWGEGENGPTSNRSSHIMK